MTSDATPPDSALVTIASFTSPHEADLAKMHLEAEGFVVFLANRNAVETMGVAGEVIGPIRLQVHPADAERAERLLLAMAPPPEPDDETDEQFNTVTCLACGEPMGDDDETCPACGWSYAGGEDDEAEV